MFRDDSLDSFVGPDVSVEHLALELPGVLYVDQQPLLGGCRRVSGVLKVPFVHDVQRRLEELLQCSLLAPGPP